MTVRAEQHALRDLGLHALEGSCVAVPDRERLGRRVDVVELERRWVAVITADGAAAAGVGDEPRAHASASSNHRIGAAPRAAVVAVLVRTNVVSAWTSQTRIVASNRSALPSRVAFSCDVRRVSMPYLLSQCRTVAWLRSRRVAMPRVLNPSNTRSSSTSRARPPRAACRSAYDETSPVTSLVL